MIVPFASLALRCWAVALHTLAQSFEGDHRSDARSAQVKGHCTQPPAPCGAGGVHVCGRADQVDSSAIRLPSSRVLLFDPYRVRYCVSVLHAHFLATSWDKTAASPASLQRGFHSDKYKVYGVQKCLPYCYQNEVMLESTKLHDKWCSGDGRREAKAKAFYGTRVSCAPRRGSVHGPPVAVRCSHCELTASVRDCDLGSAGSVLTTIRNL